MTNATKDAAPLRWPPPALERLQGDLWRVAARGGLSGGILVLPFLFVAARHQDFASQGPFADAWWVTLVLAAVGLAFAIDALATASRVLSRAADAVANGYDATTVLHVLADVRKDMGFLLQGGRHFAMMDPAEREGVARLRVLAVSCHALAGLWLPSAMGVALMASARGILGATDLWGVTLVPATLLYAVGLVLAAVEEGRVRRARAAWYQQPWAMDLDVQEIEAWRRELSSRQGRENGVDLLRRGSGAGFRRGAVAALVLAALVAVPVLTLIPASAIGPVLARVAVPRLAQVQERAARVEAYRDLRLAPDPAVDALEAGGILQDLLYVGSTREQAPGEKAPRIRYEAPWLPALEGPNPVGAEPHRWPEEIFDRVRRDPTPDLMAFLDGIAAHPAHGDFARLARAAELDAIAARWDDDFAPGTSVANIPIPGFGGIRESAYAHLASAAADLARGRVGDAETKVAEVISVGFLLGDQGATLIENLIGHVLVGAGGTAMQRLYEAAGRGADAAAVSALADAADRSALRFAPGPREGTESFVRSLPDLVTDTSAVRGLRWEYFILTATLSPCLNLHRMVFGADAEYASFVERAHDSLVRWPSEEKLFALARAGYWGSVGARESLVGRFLGVSMRSGPGTCSEVVRHLEVLKEVM